MPAARPTEFRRRAVELARLREKPIALIATDLGIYESCLRRWMPTGVGAAADGPRICLTVHGLSTNGAERPDTQGHSTGSGFARALITRHETVQGTTERTPNYGLVIGEPGSRPACDGIQHLIQRSRRY